MSERRYPPVALASVLGLALVVVGGITMASYAPRRPPMGVASALAGAGIACLLIAGVMMSRLGAFAWPVFRTVFKWALLAYLVEASMIEFAFLHDHMRGAPLVVVSLMLVVFALSVPTTIAFTVARYGLD